MAVLASTAPESGVETQWRRRERVLDAALAIAATGGYEAVQMRVVAKRSGIAVGTLYRYFPSKVHLLVSVLAREIESVEASADLDDAAGTAAARLHYVIDRLNLSMQRNPQLAEAMTRAFVFADASAADEVDRVSRMTDRMFARAISGGDPAEQHYHTARVISDVWLSNLLAWLTRRASAADVSKRLDLAVRLLVGESICR
ncbi:TetR/AcrR family transcriptional regulator [Mycobacterium branderi]|uniref:HTH-type transcriptional repressor KstR n=1 Tax=Mycobacterium branderi TaxID=43348 RepID=A0ABM7KJ43_9MYCO|nr:TetR family transcriptional regulator [Mycobacterium branderi]MCV7233686.1 TetR/AcrR family transcriptional regulator [Mycobacterium branderi]BBZ11060.1 HTH-type transcriptional repressor KstR [Mycobacterium branderi]